MCSIAGIWDPRSERETTARKAREMIPPVRHRGPDGTGVAEGRHGALAHARLAIIDLEGGAQPLWDAAHATALVGNNEIYNAPRLRRELEERGRRFATQSDTEVILQGWLEWGFDVFRRLNGMFAVAILEENRCVLARDPMGIKPLHLARVGSGYAFASEIKSLLTLDDLRAETDWDAVHLFLNFRYVPDDRTLFQGIRRVSPGTYVELSERGAREERFYSFPVPSTLAISYNEAKERLAETLEAAVRRHLLADVEVAGYLSGGLDSSVVTALAAPHLSGMRTFCLGFEEPTDENEDAQFVADSVGTRHEGFKMRVGVLERLEEIIWHVEEPKVNCLQGYLLAERVSSRVKVALSGLGGDELFAGYTNHDILYPMTRLARSLKYAWLPSMEGVRRGGPGLDHFFRMTDLFRQLKDPLGFYCTLRNVFDHSPSLMRRFYESPPAHWANFSRQALAPYFDARHPDIFGALLALEARTKMINDFLLTEDRVSMAHGLEVRVPMLDRELVDLVFPMPSAYKYRPGNKKRIFRDVASTLLPPRTLKKPKWGFSVNPYYLFQKELRDFARRELTPTRVRDLGVFSWKWISEVLEHRPTPRMRWHYFNLWAICGFSLWHRQFIEREHRDRLEATGT